MTAGGNVSGRALVLDKTMVYDKINHVVNKIHQTLIRNSKNFLFFRELPDAARQ